MITQNDPAEKDIPDRKGKRKKKKRKNWRSGCRGTWEGKQKDPDEKMRTTVCGYPQSFVIWPSAPAISRPANSGAFCNKIDRYLPSLPNHTNLISYLFQHLFLLRKQSHAPYMTANVFYISHYAKYVMYKQRYTEITKNRKNNSHKILGGCARQRQNGNLFYIHLYSFIFLLCFYISLYYFALKPLFLLLLPAVPVPAPYRDIHCYT